MQQLTLISSVFVLTVNFVCTVLLWAVCRGSQPKKVLALVSTVVTVWNLFAVLLMPWLRFDRLDFFYEMTGIMMASLVYVYLRLLMEPKPDITEEYRRLGITIAVYFTLFFVIRLFEPSIVIGRYGDIFSELRHPEVWLRILAAIHFLVLYARMIFGIVRMYSRHKRRISELYSYRENISLSWVLLVGGLYILYGLASTVDIFFAEPDSVQVVVFNFFFAGFYLAVNLVGAIQKDVYTTEQIAWIENDENQMVSDLSVPAKVRAELKKALEELLEGNKAYLNPDLRLEMVANMLNTNRTYVSSIINEDYGMNFIVFVNHYRIKEAQKIMQDPQGEKSITVIAEAVGFKSHSSFVEFFKRFTGMNPSEFRRRTVAKS